MTSAGRQKILAAALTVTAVFACVFAAGAGAVQITEFALPTGSNPLFIAAGPDGNMWFTDRGANKIGKITMAGEITEYGLGIAPKADLNGISGGPDGNVWFTERSGHKIGRITPSGAVTEFSTGLTGSPDVYGITPGPGGMWFTETSSARIGVIDPATGTIKELPGPSGVYTEIVQGPDGNLWYTSPDKATIVRTTPTGTNSSFGPLSSIDCATGAPSPCPYPSSIAVGSEGNLWFNEARGNAIGRITPTGGISEFTDGLTHGAGISDLATGPEGNIWFAESSINQIGRITPTGTVTEFSAGISEKAQPFGIALGPDQNLWVTEFTGGKIARVIPDVAPVIATGPPSRVSRTREAVTGTVRSRGSDTRYYFQYGTSPAYGKKTHAGDNGAGDTTVPVDATLHGLLPQHVYHYRIVASNAYGTSVGADATFKTGKRPLHVSVKPFEMYFAGAVFGGSRLRLSSVTVIHVHRGEKVSFHCGGCHGSHTHGREHAKKTRVTFSGLGLNVTRSSSLTIAVSGKNGSKRVKTYGFRISRASAKQKLKREHCFVAGKHKPVSCSSKHHHHRHGKR